jgi:hypothetical protein
MPFAQKLYATHFDAEGKQRHNIQSDMNPGIQQASTISTLEKVESEKEIARKEIAEKKEVLDINNVQVDPITSQDLQSTADQTNEQELDRQITVFEPLPGDYSMPKCKLTLLIGSRFA